MGLVEVGVGVIPAAGGCKEMLLRLGEAKKAMELIGFAKVSTSAANARELGLLRPQDGITMNRERLVADLGDRHVMLLRNHGTLTVGETVTGVGNAGGAGGTPRAARGKITALGRTITAS